MVAHRPRSLFWRPLLLGAIQAILSATLVVVAISVPPRNESFRGLVNDTNSRGAIRRLNLFRDALSWLPGVGEGFDLEPRTYVWGLRATLTALAILQVIGLHVALRETGGPPWRWLIGPALTSLVLLAYPPFSADVFFYALSGHVANDGANPYQTPPRDFPDDPFLRYNDWRGITSPYGPLWTSVSRGLIAITGPDPTRAAIAFKVTAGLAALALAWTCYRIAERITDDRRIAVAVLVLVAWQPALLIESAGTAHNDAVMMLLAVGGLSLLLRGEVRSGLVVIGASALIKYVTLPMLGFAVLSRLANRESRVCRLLGRWSLDIAAIALLSAIVFWPYWIGRDTIQSLIKEPARLYVNPLWVLPRLAVADRWGTGAGNDFRDTTRTIAQWSVGLILIVTTLWLIVRVWLARHKGCDGGRVQFPAWASATATLALLPVNAHAWYAVWAVGPVALAWASAHRQQPTTADDTVGTARVRLPRWLWLYLVWSAISYLVYHTRIIR